MMTEAEKETMRRNVKAALKWVGPREVLALVMTEVVERRDGACNQDSKARLRIAVQKIEAVLRWMDRKD